MAIESRKTLKDFLLNGELSKVSFYSPHLGNGIPYQVVDLDSRIGAGHSSLYMKIKYENGREDSALVDIHLNDERVVSL